MRLLFYNSYIQKIVSSRFVKDSGWAVFGNGFANLLLLIVGIIFARLLGKDLYGEYGVVKTTMFHIAAFSTFGLQSTATKIVADYLGENKGRLIPSIKACLRITIIVSFLLMLLLLLFSKSLAIFANEPSLEIPFRYLGVILVCQAITSTTTGILAGFKEFKGACIINNISALSLLILGFFFTYLWGLNGTLLALLVNQIINALLNSLLIKYKVNKLPQELYLDNNYKADKDVLFFTFPIALQELSYTFSTWGSTLLLTRYSSLGEVGLWSAAAQWNSVILVVPGLLSNVILSYLSSTKEHKIKKKMVNRMLLINLCCTLFPFIVVVLLSGLITSFYGPSFENLKNVLNISIFSSIFIGLSNVLQSNLLSLGRTWLLFSLRLVRDSLIIIVLFVTLKTTYENAAQHMALIFVCVYFFYFLLMYTAFIRNNK